MGQRVVLVSDGHRVDGCGADGELVNRFLAHLGSRAFSSATVRAYAYDLLNFLRFLADRRAGKAHSHAGCRRRCGPRIATPDHKAHRTSS
jgi:integrase/recombinase XerC